MAPLPSIFAYPASHIIRVPDNVSFGVAALVEPLSCCVRSLNANGVRPGRSVVILGAGPIGNLQTQLARLLGAAPIIVLDLAKERLDRAIASGANYAVTDMQELRKIIAHCTDGLGADLVIESVGVKELYELCFQLVRPGGQVSAFGLAPPSVKSQFAPFDVVLKEFGMKGTVASSSSDFQDALALFAI